MDHRVIPAVRRRRQKGPGSLGWESAPWFLVFFRFSFCSSSPVSESIARDGVGGFALCASIPFRYYALFPRLSFLSLSLALTRTDPAVSYFPVLFLALCQKNPQPFIIFFIKLSSPQNILNFFLNKYKYFSFFIDSFTI